LKPAELAKYYLKFYSGPTPADNAPISVLLLHGKCKHPGLVKQCLTTISESTVLPDPEYLESMEWLARNPNRYAACDEYLNSKKGKKVESPFAQSVIAAYAAEQLKYYDVILKVLRADLLD